MLRKIKKQTKKKFTKAICIFKKMYLEIYQNLIYYKGLKISIRIKEVY